ncbi:hypothetical protein SDC9_102138 [bioreactor metagenome]|uniref:Uncharacterized protein n=1 Tax=bioreactor metagenome TaxID=1076179 RepID=A0A645B0R3_9ZZZZ
MNARLLTDQGSQLAGIVLLHMDQFFSLGRLFAQKLIGQGPYIAEDQRAVALAAFLVQKRDGFLQRAIVRPPADQQHLRVAVAQQFRLLQVTFEQFQLAHALVHHADAGLAVLDDLAVLIMLVAVGGYKALAGAGELAGRYAVFRVAVARVIAVCGHVLGHEYLRLCGIGHRDGGRGIGQVLVAQQDHRDLVLLRQVKGADGLPVGVLVVA